MADQSDVETALVTLAADALYPGGTAARSVSGQACRVYRGWPNPAALDADLRAGVTNVTVMAIEGTARNMTRYPDTWLSDPPPPALTASAVGPTVTFGGTADPGQLAGIAVDGKTYVYRTQAADTASLVAASLAGQIRADRIVDLTGSAMTIFGAAHIVARVAADATARMEVRRQTQRFQIVLWCNTPAARDAAATVIDQALAPLRFMSLPDGSSGRLSFANTSTIDRSENAALYRRNLLYDVEYPTTISVLQPTLLFGVGSINGNSAIG